MNESGLHLFRPLQYIVLDEENDRGGLISRLKNIANNRKGRLFSFNGTYEDYKKAIKNNASPYQYRNLLRKEHKILRGIYGNVDKNAKMFGITSKPETDKMKGYAKDYYQKDHLNMFMAHIPGVGTILNKGLIKDTNKQLRNQENPKKITIRFYKPHEDEHKKQYDMAKKLYGVGGVRRMQDNYQKQTASNDWMNPRGRYVNHPMEYTANQAGIGEKPSLSLKDVVQRTMTGKNISGKHAFHDGESKFQSIGDKSTVPIGWNKNHM